MPFGSKLAITNASADLTPGTVLPASVPAIGPHDANGNSTLLVTNMAGHQGSVHTVPVTLPNGCVVGGNNTRSSSFNLTITSPSGVETVYPFSLSYPIQ